jgi:bacterioferritin-associated ferredoxin
LKVILNSVRLRRSSGERALIVCSCHAVTDREIRRLARAGASTARDVANSCGAGSACGGCRSTVVAILEEVETPHAARAPLSAASEAA